MNTAELEFREYRATDRSEVIALLAQGRPATYASDKAAVFDWQFMDNPESGGKSPFVIGTVRDEIVAVTGLMPVRARLGGELVSTCWALDVYVSSAFRGRGFGKALVAHVSKSADVMLAFGISNMSDPIFEQHGWVLDPSMATLFYHANEVGLKGFAKNLLTRSSRTLRARKVSRLADIRLEPPPPSDELDALWARVASQFPSAVERTARYLTWRYRAAPVLRYRWIAARREGELCGVLITRHDPIESVIVDYVGPLDDPTLLASLLEVGRADLVSSDTRRVRCEANDPTMLDELAAAGFHRHRVPSRFRIRANVSPRTDRARWFVMAGDSDDDLITR